MKRIRILFIAFAVGITFSFCTRVPEEPDHARKARFRLVRLHYENSEGEKAITHFHYDMDEHNYMAVWYLADSSRSSLNYHTLDSSGRMLVKSREFSDGIRTIQHFEYDGNGNLLREDFNRSDGVTGEVDYVYGEDGKPLYADCRGLNGWFYGTIKYIWADGKKTSAELLKDSVKTGRIDYKYEGERLIGEKWEFPGNWSQTFRYEYQEAAIQTYTSPNVFIRESPWFRVASEYYEFNGESGGPSHYTYDESGKMTHKKFVRSDGLTTMSTYEYNSAGLLDLSMREYGDGRTTDFLYWYSVDRKLLVKTFEWSDGTSGSETYRYKDGKLIRGEYMNMDGWLNGILEFAYDEKNILNSAKFKGEDGFDATVDFTYDLDFNLLKINWQFSSGHAQAYDFKYIANTQSSISYIITDPLFP